VTEPPGNTGAGREPSLEERAAGLLAGAQRWVIRTTARNVGGELSGQMRRALRGSRPDGDTVWNTATTEDPSRAHEPPECSWCPVCRAARALARAGRETMPRDRVRPPSAAGRAAPRQAGPASRPGSAADPWAQAATGDQTATDDQTDPRDQTEPRDQTATGEQAQPRQQAEPGRRAGSGALRPAGPAAAPGGGGARPGPAATLASAPQALAAMVGDAIRVVDAVLSYRPPAPRPPGGGTDEPDDRG
jgi:hypothetical protein